MTRARTLVVLAALFCLALPAVPAQAKTSNSRSLVNAINFVRVTNGVKPLRVNRSLSRSSKRYSNRMMRTGYFGHASRIQASRRFRRLGEVLEWRRGHKPGVRATVRDWMRSPGHRAVILSPSFRYIGAGLSRGKFRGRRASIWVAQLGR